MAGRSVSMKLGRGMAVPEVEVVVSEAQGEDMEAAADSVVEEVEVAEDMEVTGATEIGAMVAAETEVTAATEAMAEETEAMAVAADTGAAVEAVATPPVVATEIIVRGHGGYGDRSSGGSYRDGYDSYAAND